MLTLLIAAAACGRGGESRAYSPQSVEIDLDSSGGAANTFVVVSHLHPSVLEAVRKAAGDTEKPAAWLYVIGPSDYISTSPMAGRVVVNDTGVELHPRFPLDAGREYGVGIRSPSTIDIANRPPEFMSFVVPARAAQTRTSVRAVYPSSDTVPENLLRVYIEFTAPMSRTGGLDFISLRDEHDKVVPATFLPLDADFWNSDRTRYTAFLDPGRVKRGILPNEQMGRAIRAGHRYTIVVDSAWRDANGQPLTSSMRRSFAVAAADERVIDVAAWQIHAPTSGRADTLTVTFPKPLDRGLLLRALGVVGIDGETIDGDVLLANGERVWRFVPRTAWRAGAYQLLVLNILEDPAGNRIDRPFEVDMFDRVDRSAAPERRLILFTVR